MPQFFLDNSIFLNSWWFKDVKNGNPKCPKYSNLRFDLRSDKRSNFCTVPTIPVTRESYVMMRGGESITQPLPLPSIVHLFIFLAVATVMVPTGLFLLFFLCGIICRRKGDFAKVRSLIGSQSESQIRSQIGILGTLFV